jgi:hypothetical protein
VIYEEPQTKKAPQGGLRMDAERIIERLQSNREMYEVLAWLTRPFRKKASIWWSQRAQDCTDLINLIEATEEG